MPSAQAQTWNGNATNSNWLTGSNWNPSGTPINTSTVTLSNGTTATINAAGATASRIFVYNDSGITVSSSGTLTANTVSVSSTLSSGIFLGENRNFGNTLGTMTVNGGTVSAYQLFVGSHGNGTLTITNGGSVSSAISYVGFGAYYSGNTVLSQATGSATISGASSKWNAGTLFVGLEATGSMLISGGSTVTASSLTVGYMSSTDASLLPALTSNGTLNVTGLGSSVNVTGGGDVTIGTGSRSQGVVVIGDGAAANLGSSDVNIGAGATTASGSLTITGVSGATNSKLATTGNITVGTVGNGSLSVNSGGILSNANAIIGGGSAAVGTAAISNAVWTNSGTVTVGNAGTGTLNVNSGSTVNSGTVTVGSAVGSVGTVNIDNSTWTLSNTLNVGASGTGTVNASGGAKLVGTSAILGVNSGGNGTLSLTGAGTALTLSGSLIAGNSGSGTLVIADSATAQSATATIGSQIGSTGSATVTSGGQWTVTNTLSVGEAGTGTLTISGGGKVSSAQENVGNLAGSRGTVVINGAGSVWTTSGTLIVGNSGSGTIALGSGGRIAATSITLGNQTGSTGTISVDNSTLSLTTLVIGSTGSGTLSVTSGGQMTSTTASIAVNAGSQGNITISGTGSTWTLSNALIVGQSGTGSVTIADGGTIVAPTTVTLGSLGGSSGTLNIGAAAGSAAVGAGTINATTISSGAGVGIIQYNHTGTATNTASIVGSTSLIQNAGTTVLSAAAAYAYTDGTVVNGGVLDSKGNLTGAAGAVTINGGTLLSEGSILTSGATVTNGGLFIAATKSISNNVNVYNGTFGTGSYYDNSLPVGVSTVSGNLTLRSGSSMGVHITGTTSGTLHDVVHVTGTATLNGPLYADFNNSLNFIPTLSSSYTILTATSVVGSFSSVIPTLNNYIVFADNGSTATTNTLTISLIQKSFTTAAGNSNQMAVAKGFNNQIYPGSPMLPVVDYLNAQGEGTWTQALNLMSPEQLTAMGSAAFANADSMFNMLGSRFTEIHNGQRYSDSGLVIWDPNGELHRNSLLASTTGTLPNGYQPAKPTFIDNPNLGFFISGQGTFGDIKGDSTADGYNFNAGGVLLGCDYRLSDNAAVGGYFGYQGTETDLSNDGNIHADSGKFGVYGTYWWDNGAWFNASIGGGVHEYSTHRGSLGGQADGNTTGTEFNFQMQEGYDFHAGRWTFGPTIEADYTHLSIDSYSEQGSLTPLTINTQEAESMRMTVGGRVTTTVEVNNGQWKISPYANVGLRHEFLDQQQAVTAAFANGTGGAFTVNGPSPSSESLVGGVGVSLQLSPRWTGNLGYLFEGNDDYTINSIMGTLVFRF